MGKFFSILKDKEFIGKVFVVAIPMILQQLITTSVNLLDNLMVGQLGGASIAAVATSNKYLMIANFGMMGIVTAGTIYLAQYYGANKPQKMKESFRYSLIFSLVIVLLFSIPAFLTPRAIISFFASNESLIEFGMQYLPIAALTMFPQAISYTIQSSMRSIGNTRLPLISSIISIFTNAFFNYLLIFGHFGFPQLGVVGAALGTLIARCVELFYLLVVLRLNKFQFKTRLRTIFNISKDLAVAITKKASPLLLNEIAWSGGMAMLFKFYASKGDIALAALPIASTTADLFFVLFSGVSVATIVMVSHPLGSNKLDEARENGYKMIRLSVLLSVVFALGLVTASFITPHLYNISEEVFDLASNFIRVQALFFWIYMYNAQTFFVMRAGGDTKSTLIMDAGFMWLVNIPLVAFVAYSTPAHAILIYISGQLTDVIKMFVATYYFRKEKWVKNLTQEIEVELV